MIDDARPIFQQIAQLVEADILDGTLAEDAQVPSTNEFAAFYRINPATAAKGINQLVADGILYKKRGIGMFVAVGARRALLDQRRREFAEQYVDPLLTQASKLGIETAQLLDLIEARVGVHDGGAGVVPGGVR